MPIYLVTPLADNCDAVSAAVKEAIEQIDAYKLQNEAGWLVSFPGTSVELSNTLKITGQEPGTPSPVGSAMVTSIGSYYGRGSTEMWEWLKTRFERMS